MIPPFNSHGYLPAGVHAATLAEVAERFGGASELRRVQMESVREMIALAVRAGVQRIVLNGSFVKKRGQDTKWADKGQRKSGPPGNLRAIPGFSVPVYRTRKYTR